MIPPTIVLVPNYLIAAVLGLTNSLWACRAAAVVAEALAHICGSSNAKRAPTQREP